MPALDLPAPPWIVGHRGVRGAVPENTVDSVREAVAQRADMVELDLQLTADKRLVVHHDLAVKISDEESKPVGRATLEEIKRCRQVRKHKGQDLAYEIPTLDEVLALFPRAHDRRCGTACPASRSWWSTLAELGSRPGSC